MRSAVSVSFISLLTHKQDKTLPTVRRQDYILMLFAPKALVKQSRKATSHFQLEKQPRGSAHCLLSHSPPNPAIVPLIKPQ